MNPSKPTETLQPQTTNDHSKATSIVPSKTATRESLHLSTASGAVSLARILHQFARNASNETSSTPVNVSPTSAFTVPSKVNNTSMTVETRGLQVPSVSSQNSSISHLCEQLSVGRTATPSRPSENHKVRGSCHTQATLHTSTARPTWRSSCSDPVPKSNGECGAMNPALHSLVYFASPGSQNVTTTDPKFVEVPEVGLRGRKLFCASEGGAKSTCLNAYEGGAKSTRLDAYEGGAKNMFRSASEGGTKSTCHSASEGGAKNTCLSAQGVSFDKASRSTEDCISRLKEFVQKKEKEVERIQRQLHLLEEHKASLAFETAILESAKKRPRLHGHNGPVSRVSKIRSKVSNKNIRVHKARDSGNVEVKPAVCSVNAFLPNFKEKGFLELLGLEVVVESIVQITNTE